MKSIKKYSSILMIALLVAAPMAFAAGGTVSLKFSSPVIVAGNTVDQGDYLVRWKSSSPEATVAFEKKNGAVVAAVNARLVERDQAARVDSVLVTTGPNGERILKEIRIRGKKQVLVFE